MTRDQWPGDPSPGFDPKDELQPYQAEKNGNVFVPSFGIVFESDSCPSIEKNLDDSADEVCPGAPCAPASAPFPPAGDPFERQLNVVFPDLPFSPMEEGRKTPKPEE